MFKNLTKSCLIIGILLFYGFFALSQSDVTYNLEELKKAYPDEDVIVVKSEVTYSVELDKSNVPIAIIETVKEKYLSLKPKVFAKDIRFYDMFSEITKHKVSGTGIFLPSKSQRCGNYEINGIFYHDAKVCEFFLEFNKAGQYLTVKIKKKYNDFKYFTRIPFSQNYAIKERTVRFEIPANIEMDLLEMNFDAFDIAKEEHKVENPEMSIIEYKISDIPSSYKLENLPAYSCSFPHLLALFKSYENSGELISLIENTDDLYNWYKTLFTESELSPETAKIINKIIDPTDSDTAKIAAVYYWVQDKIRYIAFENGFAAFTPDDPNNVCKVRYGDCKGMANLLKAMLKHLGFDARLCWIYSGNTCYSRETPSIAVDNHMICAVKLNGSFIFLDPTIEYSSLFDVNENIQGKECWVENGDKYILEQIPSTPFSTNLTKVNNYISLVNNKFIVKGNVTLKGNDKKMLQYFLNHQMWGEKEEFINYFVTKSDNNFLIKNNNSTPIDSITDSFEIHYEMEVSNKILDLGNKILLSLDFYNEFRDNKIDSTRKFDYALDTRELKQHDVVFRIPDNMKIADLPKTLSVEHPKFKFSGKYSDEDSLLVYKKTLSIIDNIIAVEEFNEWNNAIDKLVKFYDEVVVLEKK